MKYQSLLVIPFLVLAATQGFAAGDLSRNSPQEAVLEMGTKDGRMYFKPNHLEFETGKAYKILLKNMDSIKHEIEATEFVEKIFTRKVEVKHDGKLIAEIKGSIREIEVGPNAEVEWYLVPVQTGVKLAMNCALKDHREAGMFGTITVN